MVRVMSLGFAQKPRAAVVWRMGRAVTSVFA